MNIQQNCTKLEANNTLYENIENNKIVRLMYYHYVVYTLLSQRWRVNLFIISPNHNV